MRVAELPFEGCEMTDELNDRPWWFPELTNEKWLARIRSDYPENAAGKDDDELREEYADGWKYADTWDHLGDARGEYEKLADAYLELLAKQPVSDDMALLSLLADIRAAADDPTGKLMQDELVARIAGLRESVDRLDAEARQHFVQAMKNGEAALRAERERDELRVDAERYRWVRDVLRHDDKRWDACGNWNHSRIDQPKFDAAIDAARSAHAPE
jgi:hypothetical protein